MLQWLVEFSIRNRGVVTALACLMTAYGIYVAAHAQFDVYPEFAPPRVVIQTEAPGLSPEEVEQLVTRPVEYAVNGVPQLESMRSQSLQGLSVVTVQFREGAEIMRARQTVNERLAEVAERLPRGVHTPGMAPLTGATSLILALGLTSNQRTPMELRTFADWTLRPRLLGVPGVARISVYGGEVRQLQIQIPPERLAAYNLPLKELVEAARAASGVRGAGFVETATQRIVLRTEGQSLTPAELGEAILAHRQGVPLRLRDVARVVEDAEPKISEAAIGGQRGVIVLVDSQFGSNTLAVTAAVEAALEEIKPALEGQYIQLHPALFRPANFIHTSVRNVSFSLLLGGLLVCGVLFGFLLNVRTAFISLTAIPLSLLAAVIVLDRLGLSLNTLTLGGLAIAIGEVVDDAIIDVENIFRRLRENQAGGSPRSRFRVVLEASLEVRSAVVYATLVVVLVFLPVLAMTGLQGRLFAPLGLAYVLAILASLVVALTLTPALSCLLLARPGAAPAEPPLVRWLKARYAALLGTVFRRPAPLVAGAAALCAASAALIPIFGATFLPELREGYYVVCFWATPGTSLEESLRLGRNVTRDLLASPNVLSVAQQVGRAEKGEDVWGTHYSEFHVQLNPNSPARGEEVEAEIRRIVNRFPGVNFAIHSFLVERMEEILSGVIGQVVVKIFSDDLDVLDRKAQEMAAVLARVRGAADVRVESQPGVPEIRLALRRDRLRQLGFEPVEVLEAVGTAYQGTVVSQVYEGNRVVDVNVILHPDLRRDPAAVGSLLVDNGAGVRVPLRALAEIRQTSGRYSILHDGTQRRQAVICNVQGRDVSSFVNEARRELRKKVVLPAGAYTVFTGTDVAREEAQREMLLHSLLAGAGILLLLAMVFRGARNLLLVLVNLPFTLVGGVVAVFLTGGWLTVGSMVGFVTLFGITMRNSIMMVSHFEHLVREEGAAWGLEAALRGASERLAPVLMTALATALGLLPLALGSGDAGREVEGPMAIVILGGLVTSTALNLLLLPWLALRFGRFNGAGLRDPAGDHGY
jgi:CzcA family heavy metal efflux pump